MTLIRFHIKGCFRFDSNLIVAVARTEFPILNIFYVQRKHWLSVLYTLSHKVWGTDVVIKYYDVVNIL